MRYGRRVSLAEILREVEVLQRPERLRVMERLHELTEADMPESFREGMEDIRAGRVMELDEA